MFAEWRAKLRARVVDALTQHRERHGIKLSMYIENAPLREADLWPKLEAALDLIATHRPIWLERMRRTQNSINIRRIPGLRAQLRPGSRTILDPFLLANFEPAQIASSIVHEATHAALQARGLSTQMTRVREERICRGSELRLGRALAAAGIPGANAVVTRAAFSLAASDDDVAPRVDPEDLRVLGIVTRINDLPFPRWYKRFLAKRQGVLDTPQGRSAFGR
ncbi:MAG TPA: hypothetical protein VGD27_19810 [Longimicrobiales bacterium]